MEYLITLVPRIPLLLGWVSAIIVAVILVKRGAPSKLFLWGSILMFIGTILGGVFNIYLLDWLRSNSISAASAGFTMSLATLFIAIIELAGIILIIIGFWKSASRRA